MDHIDLNVGIPLLIQDQNKEIIYVDKFGSEQGLIEDEANFIEKNEELMKGEALLIESNSMKESVINSDLVSNQTFLLNNDEGEIESVKSKNEINSSNENLNENLFDNNNFKTVKESEIYLNGQMIKLADGTTAFVENSEGGNNEVYTPIRLYNGSIIYVVSETLLSNNLDGTKSCENEEQMEKAEPAVTEQKQENSKGFQCSYKNCNKSYTSFHHLKVHLRVHTGDRPFRCSVEGCNKAFSTGFGLKTHFRTHNGERPYTCNHLNCEKGFKTSGDLQKHIRTHTGERPFLCPIPNCGRSFTTCNICKVHVRTHTGERPYKCTYPNCDKTFASVTNQRNHMRIHSGEKPYVCPVEKCGRRFTEYSSLYKHNMVHRQQPHLCLICGKTYRQASSLMMHTKTAHGDQETYLMIDKNSEKEANRESEQTAILFVNNIKLEDGVLEDPLFTEFRESSQFNV